MTLASDAPDLLAAFAGYYTDYVEQRRGRLDFAYCDVVADKLTWLFELGDVAVRARVLFVMLGLGVSHNRWFVERRFVSLAGPSLDLATTERFLLDVDVKGINILYDIEHLERSIGVNRTQLSPALHCTASGIPQLSKNSIASFNLPRSGKENGDALAYANLPGGGLMLAIADGVGSASHGGDAAALATRTCLDLRDIVDIPTLFREVDAKIQMAAKAESGQWSSTLSVCLIRDQHARFGHVGDTRIYHLRGKGLQTRTHDQTEVARLIEQGILTPERALRYPRRHVLVSVMKERMNCSNRALNCTMGTESYFSLTAFMRRQANATLLICRMSIRM